MGQRGVSHRLVSVRTTNPGRLAGAMLLAVFAQAGLAAPARAQFSLTASRTGLLYSASTSVDCSTLSMKADTELPFNIARIAVVGTPAGQVLTYHWSMKKDDQGFLAADMDIGPSGATPAVSAMCADFGSACTLTEGKVDFYTLDHILWVAPTCTVLPKDTSRPFRGGVSHVRVKVTNGRKKVGNAAVNLGWGMNGAVTLFVTDMENPPRFQDGIGRREPIPIFANPTFAFRESPPNPAPQGLTTFQFTPGSFVGEQACSGFDGCGEVDFSAPGRVLEMLAVTYSDGSALCDNLNVRVATCAAKAGLEVIPRPKRSLYDPAGSSSMVDLTVRLKNRSVPEGGLPACNFLLRGAGVLSCSSDINVGGVKDTQSTTFDLQHCSQTIDQPCLSDADCGALCGNCAPNETCLTKPHCATHFNRECGNDSDCDPKRLPSPNCPECNPNEACVRVIKVGPGADVFITPGGSVDLLHQPVTLRNVLSNTAKITDTWTGSVLIPGVSASAKVKYKIRGRPLSSP